MGNTDSSVELPDQGDHVIRTYDEVIDEHPDGFGYQLFQYLKKYNSETAQIEASTGRQESFKSFRRRCISVAIELKKRGITPEDIVTPCTSNHMDSSIAFLAPLLLGAKPACLDPDMPVADVKALLDLTRPKVLFVSKNAEEKIERIVKELKLASELVVFGNTERNTPFQEFLNHLSDEDEASFVPYKINDPQEMAYMIFSSGSTGVPKGICYSHLVACHSIGLIAANNIGGVVLAYSTLVWGSGIFSVIGSVVSGSPKLICSIFEPAKTWKYIAKYGVERVVMAPHDTVSLIKYGKPPEIDSSAVKMFGLAGGSISSKSIEILRQVFPNAFVFCPYGQSEVPNQVFGVRMDRMGFLWEKPNCVGWPVRGFWYKIVDPVTGEICGPNKRGELRLKTRFQMSGYYKIDSSASWDEYGFLRTGDIAFYDEQHSFFVVERLKEVFRYKMRPIAPSHLENVLHDHPGVKVAVVVGLPTDEGELPLALVVRKSVEVTSDELQQFLSARIEEMGLPRIEVRFIDERHVEKTASGKIRRFLLRRKVLDGDISGS